MTAARELPRAVSGLTMEIVRVSPSIAEKWLGKNTRNRKVTQFSVNKWARAMDAGEWLVSGEAIKFAVTGELIDGQHRLLAVIKSGKTIPFLVVRGLPASVFDVLDTGRARTASDALSIAGFPNHTNLAAAARVAILWETGRFNTEDKQVSTAAILDYVTGNEILAFAASRSHSIAKGSELQPSIAGMTYYELMKINDEKAHFFFDRLSDGVELPARSPILALRSRLRNLRDDHVRLPIEASVGLVFRAWNSWRTGKTLSGLPLYSNGALIACPEPAK